MGHARADLLLALADDRLIGLGSAMEWTSIRNPGNACDPQLQGCFGAVGYAYQIGTYEVTNAQYAEFLNPASDPLGLCNTWATIHRPLRQLRRYHAHRKRWELQLLPALFFFEPESRWFDSLPARQYSQC